jgi:Fe-S-cluster containining protein
VADDRELIQIVDAALAEANRKAGAWLVCRAGCFECCIGSFPISELDAARLLAGMAQLEAGRAERIRERARAFVGEEMACPVLDPETGMCELYECRPLTCRTFGPALRWPGEAIGVCELNFVGASQEEIVACSVEIPGEEPSSDEETTVANTFLAADEPRMPGTRAPVEH